MNTWNIGQLFYTATYLHSMGSKTREIQLNPGKPRFSVLKYTQGTPKNLNHMKALTLYWKWL